MASLSNLRFLISPSHPDEIVPIDLTKKKKKKTENLSVCAEPSFAGLKKKNKKPVEILSLLSDGEIPHDGSYIHLNGEEEGEKTQLPWEGYQYGELLGKVYSSLRDNNPELARDRRRTVMNSPQVLREGTKKTVFVNFMDLCTTMHRQPEHVIDYLKSELGTTAYLGQERLVVNGRFSPKHFEVIMRRYANEYLICNGCKSSDTTLTKENRIFFIRCEQCGSIRSVAPVKAGFVARVGRRVAA